MGIVEETQDEAIAAFMPTTTIKGSKVVNVSEEHLGMLEEMMIDPEKGKIAYAVLSFGGFLGIGNKLFAIPWEVLESSRGDYILRIEKSVLEKMEGFDKEEWSLTRDELAKVYAHFEIQPYWETKMGIVEETQDIEIGDFLPTTTIKGSKVINVNKEHLGKIEEVMIDANMGRIAYAVLSFGGFLGIGNKLFAIPWEVLELNRGEYILRIDKSVLEKMEGFDKEEWSLTHDELAKVYAHFGIQPYWQTKMGIVEETQDEAIAAFIPTTTIKGSKVVNVKEEHLGMIEELIIDAEKGKIAYAVLSFGGFLGIGNKLFPIPWEALELNRYDYILKIDKSVLEKAEGFDKEEWSLTHDELAKVYAYFGIQPHWEKT
jgi:sporulation protein YlmC with PRC-barrel domain